MNKLNLFNKVKKDYIKEEQELLEMAYMKDGDFNFGHQIDDVKLAFENDKEEFKELIDTFSLNNELYRSFFYAGFIITKHIHKNIIVNVIGLLHNKLKGESKNKYGDSAFIVNTMFTEENFRKKGLSKHVIQNLINLGYPVMGDYLEYQNARKLWVSLNGMKDYKMDIINKETGKINMTGVKLENIYDKNLWFDIGYPKQFSGNLQKKIHNIIVNTRSIMYK